MIAKCVLNEILHHVGMSWIICPNKEIFYEIDKINHPDWLNKGPWYNTDIFSKLHGELLEGFITHARTDRYNIIFLLLHIIKNNLHMNMNRAVLETGQ